jgi:hypothetical protein
MNGIEVLFISGAVGIVLYGVLAFFGSIVIGSINWISGNVSTIQNLPIAPSISWNYPPFELTSPFVVISEIFVIAMCWFYISTIIYVFIKVIQYCLDPKKEIFQKLERFEIIKRYQLKEIFHLGIPLILIYLAVLLFLISYGIGFFQNVLDFKFSYLFYVRQAFFTVYGIVGVILAFFLIYAVSKLLCKHLTLFLPFVSLLKELDRKNVEQTGIIVEKMFQQIALIKESKLRRYVIEKFFYNHWMFAILFFGVLIALFLIMLYIQPIYFPVRCDVIPNASRVICFPEGPFSSYSTYSHI